jgi:uracil-DNA glycosylase
VLRAFRQPLDDVRVLIVGQDPYPTPGHPVGLCFSVAPDVRPLPKSLVNIYTELRNDLGEPTPAHGDLTPWSHQGVLLLNRVLTVSPGKPGSHQGLGWEAVTAAAIEALVARGGPLVAILWGRHARSLVPMLDGVPRVESAHPVALVRLLRVLRLPPVQPGQRPAGQGRGPAGRLEARMNAAQPLPRIWTRYVALGDSFTEGMSDPDPQVPGQYVGWADRLAVELARYASDAGQSFGYANLAVRGRLLADIVGPQLDAALALEPDLVSIVGGGNDILRPSVDVEKLAGRLEEAVVRIRETGADVLMATPFDPVGAPVVRAARGRSANFAALVWGIAQRHGARVLDQWSLTALRDWRMWAEDRIHMTAEGHRRVALAALWTLGYSSDETDWRTPLPPSAPVPRREVLAGNAKWARDYLAPWVQRRLRGESSGDLLTAKRPAVTPLDQQEA